jgi:hypothetical protein
MTAKFTKGKWLVTKCITTNLNLDDSVDNVIERLQKYKKENEGWHLIIEVDYNWDNQQIFNGIYLHAERLATEEEIRIAMELKARKKLREDRKELELYENLKEKYG